MCTGNLSSAVFYFTLESEANEDPPEFTLTCQSRGGPVTEVELRRNGVRVEEDSNHMTSQIIVDTSRNTVYNNTLRVKGRETGTYVCTVRHNAQTSLTVISSGTREMLHWYWEVKFLHQFVASLKNVFLSNVHSYWPHCHLPLNHKCLTRMDICSIT